MRKCLLVLVMLLPASTTRADDVRRSENFMVQAPDEVSAVRILHDAEKARLDFGQKWFGHPPTWKVPVPIVVQIQPFHVNGYMKRISDAFIYVELLGRNELQAEDALRHEIGHTVIHNEFGPGVPRWLHEGVCVADELLFGSYPTRFEEKIGRVPLWVFFNLDNVPPWFDGHEYYGQAASLVCFIRERWGPEAVWQFYRVASRRGYETASVWVFHMPLDLFEIQWTLWLHSYDSPYPRRLRGTPIQPAPVFSVWQLVTGLRQLKEPQ